MAEIEHFCDPEDKSHPKFDTVRHTPVSLISQHLYKLKELCD